MAWCRQAPSHYLSQCWPRSSMHWQWHAILPTSPGHHYILYIHIIYIFIMHHYVLYVYSSLYLPTANKIFQHIFNYFVAVSYEEGFQKECFNSLRLREIICHSKNTYFWCFITKAIHWNIWMSGTLVKLTVRQMNSIKKNSSQWKNVFWKNYQIRASKIVLIHQALA